MDQLAHPAHPTDAPSVGCAEASQTGLLCARVYHPQTSGTRVNTVCPSPVFHDNSTVLGLGLAALWALQTGNATLETAAVPCGCNSNPPFVLIYFTEMPFSITACIINRRKNRGKVAAQCVPALALMS